MAVQVSQWFIDMITSMRDGEQTRLDELDMQLSTYVTAETLAIQRAAIADERTERAAKKADYDAVLADLEAE